MPTQNPATTRPLPVRTHVRVSEYAPRAASNELETALSFWRDIHPQVARQARDAYENGDFAGAIREALKSVHAVVQERVLSCSGIELEGETLMNRTFSPGMPIIALGDVSTRTGRNTQQGFMNLFAGSMIGLSNPVYGAKDVPKERHARHVIYLASLLMHKLDECPPDDQLASRRTSTATESFARLP